MGYGRVIKNSTYNSRKRVPMKRRRECKTNYKKRHTMIRQNLKKPNFQQTRFSVRFTNRHVICQLLKSYPNGDITLESANSEELSNLYKFPSFSLKNFTAAYLTAFLLGSRVMRKSRLHKIYRGNTTGDLGVPYLEKNLVNQPATYRAILDIGLKRPSKGSKLFAALKGITDAGVFVPHKPKLFFGFDKKENQLNSEKLANRIRGQDLAKYIKTKLEENEKNSVESHEFSQWKKLFLKNRNLEESFGALVDQTIANIRKNPKRVKKSKSDSKVSSRTNIVKKVIKQKKKKYAERIADIQQQKAAWMESIGLTEDNQNNNVIEA